MRWLRRFGWGRASIPAGYTLKVPQEVASRTANLKVPEPRKQITAPATDAVHAAVWCIPCARGTRLSIARKYGVSLAQLKAANGLSTNTVRVGQRLVISKDPLPASQISAASDNSQKRESSKPSAPVREAKEARGYTVRSGDTLWGVAKKLGVSVSGLRKANSLKSDKLRLGQRLRAP